MIPNNKIVNKFIILISIYLTMLFYLLNDNINILKLSQNDILKKNIYYFYSKHNFEPSLFTAIKYE